jgi:thymidine kinase
MNIQKHKNVGYLELIFGPMFSGKTTTLIQRYKQHKLLGHDICVINYYKDTRYHDTNLVNHDGVNIECIQAINIQDVLNNCKDEVKKADVIIINEGQFFDDIYETTIKLVEKYKKCVYVCGLDSDFKRNKFGRLLDLIPFCDNIFKLQSLCMNCKDGTKALFSKRITNNESQIVIGSDNYIPVCRKCYLMF